MPIILVPRKSKVTCLGDCQLVALKSIMMEVLQEILMQINSCLSNYLNPLPQQITRGCNLPGFPLCGGPLEQMNTNNSSALITIILPKLIVKLRELSLCFSLCNWSSTSSSADLSAWISNIFFSLTIS